MSMDAQVTAPKSAPEKSPQTSPQTRSPGVGAEKSPKKRNSDQSSNGTPSLIKRQLSVSAMSPRYLLHGIVYKGQELKLLFHLK